MTTSVRLVFVSITLVLIEFLYSHFNGTIILWISDYEEFVPLFLEWKNLGGKLAWGRSAGVRRGERGVCHLCTWPGRRASLSHGWHSISSAFFRLRSPPTPLLHCLIRFSPSKESNTIGKTWTRKKTNYLVLCIFWEPILCEKERNFWDQT